MSNDFFHETIFKGKGYILNKPKTYETFVDQETGEQHFMTSCRVRFGEPPRGRVFTVRARSEKAPDVAAFLRSEAKKQDILDLQGIVRFKKHIERDPDTGEEFEVMREVIFLQAATVTGVYEPETPPKAPQEPQEADEEPTPDNGEPNDMGPAQPAPEADHDDIPF